jgi:hypothetical protein
MEDIANQLEVFYSKLTICSFTTDVHFATSATDVHLAASAVDPYDRNMQSLTTIVKGYRILLLKHSNAQKV